ncbi:hypothetical protein [Sinorhizobium meliloti]
MRPLDWINGCDTGIGRYAALCGWQARHGFDAAGYQREFDSLAA